MTLYWSSSAHGSPSQDVPAVDAPRDDEALSAQGAGLWPPVDPEQQPRVEREIDASNSPEHQPRLKISVQVAKRKEKTKSRDTPRPPHPVEMGGNWTHGKDGIFVNQIPVPRFRALRDLQRSELEV